MSSSSGKSFDTDVEALRQACAVIDCMLTDIRYAVDDIRRDYAQLEEEHFKFATNYKILSDQAKLMQELDRTAAKERVSFTHDVADLDQVALLAANEQLSNFEETI